MTHDIAYLKHDDGNYYQHTLIRSKTMLDLTKYEEAQVGATIDTLTNTLKVLDKEALTLESALEETTEKRTIVRTVLSGKLNHQLDELGLNKVDFDQVERQLQKEMAPADLIVELPANEVEKTPPL